MKPTRPSRTPSSKRPTGRTATGGAGETHAPTRRPGAKPAEVHEPGRPAGTARGAGKAAPASAPPGGRGKAAGAERPTRRGAEAAGAKPAERRSDSRPGSPAARPAEAGDRPPGLQTASAKHHLLYGLHPVAAAWVNPARTVKALYVTEAARAALEPAFAHAAAEGLDRPAPQIVEKDQLDRLLPPGAVHQGIALDAAPLEDVQLDDILIAAGSDDRALVVVLDQVTDPHNVGAILRSAAAFGARAVILQDRHAPPLTGVLAKTASGAVETVPLLRVTNIARTLADLRQAGFWCVGLDESGARALHEVDVTGRTCLVLGAEGEGLRRLTMERCDEIARLPTGGPIGSLNVSNAAAVALYEVARRR